MDSLAMILLLATEMCSENHTRHPLIGTTPRQQLGRGLMRRPCTQAGLFEERFGDTDPRAFPMRTMRVFMPKPGCYCNVPTSVVRFSSGAGRAAAGGSDRAVARRNSRQFSPDFPRSRDTRKTFSKDRSQRLCRRTTDLLVHILQRLFQ